MFNHGITEVQDALRENGNPPAEFNVNLVTAFSAVLKDDAKTYEESIEDVNLNITYTQLVLKCSERLKALIINMKEGEFLASELQLVPQLVPLLEGSSHIALKKHFINPALELRLIAQTHPETPRHPRQKYYLTDLGKALQKYLKEKQ